MLQLALHHRWWKFLTAKTNFILRIVSEADLERIGSGIRATRWERQQQQQQHVRCCCFLTDFTISTRPNPAVICRFARSSSSIASSKCVFIRHIFIFEKEEIFKFSRYRNGSSIIKAKLNDDFSRPASLVAFYVETRDEFVRNKPCGWSIEQWTL